MQQGVAWLSQFACLLLLAVPVILFVLVEHIVRPSYLTSVVLQVRA